jgi:hypothetical protein
LEDDQRGQFVNSLGGGDSTSTLAGPMLAGKKFDIWKWQWLLCGKIPLHVMMT